MMGKTHRVWAMASWLTAAAPAATVRPLVAIPVAAAGVALVPWTSDGVTSPDVDRLWSNGMAGLYHWRHHKGWTHRVWFASLLTAVVVGLCSMVHPMLWLASAPLLWGWWSHLLGDMIYGKIKIVGKPRGLGLDVGDYKRVRVLWWTWRVPAEAGFRRVVWVLPGSAWLLVVVSVARSYWP